MTDRIPTRKALRAHARRSNAAAARVHRRKAKAARAAEHAQMVRARQEAIARGELAVSPGMRRNVFAVLATYVRLEVAAEHPRWSAKSREFGREVKRRIKAAGWASS